MNNNYYKTRDLAESAALLVCKKHLVRIDRMGKVCLFVFENKSDCEQIANDFYFGTLTINAREYYEAITRLKKKIFSGI